MAFEWNINGFEENMEITISDAVFERVLEFYGVDEVEDLTENQMDEIEAYRSEHVHEYSVAQVGFQALLGRWESR